MGEGGLAGRDGGVGLFLGYAVGQLWALPLCFAPAVLALVPGLLPPSAEIPDYGFLFFAMWTFFGAPVAAAITRAGRVTSPRGGRPCARPADGVSVNVPSTPSAERGSA